ncbi:hypothetical protein VTJ04DRAFT_10657 [Mycothermus thermophilus]|uniref:uncharacterized protein n=1 Tax=Humicola insolens TaxID=85995 RepID=UPI00374423C4
MFGNRTATAASVLQKTYDESYLMCSTAVYYESQGDEAEAMRCWKQALEQIYDHNANRLPANFTPRSGTEKALVDSIRQLELQCKERIDLLEALRISRQEALREGVTPSDARPTQSLIGTQDTSTTKEPGWIGDGTIPAVTYTDLARPEILRRRSGRSRPSLTPKAKDEDRTSTALVEPGPPSPSPSQTAQFSTLSRLSPEKRTSRTSSPERHALRTTLRTARSSEKKTTLRKSSSKPAEGPGANRAAMLAWSLLGHRETTEQGPVDTPELTRQSSNQSGPPEQSRKSLESMYRTWDSNSRRLMTPRNRSPIKEGDRRVSLDLTDLRPNDPLSQSRPSPLSVSAASSALNSLALRDSRLHSSPVRESILRQRAPTFPRTPQARRQNDPFEDERGLSDAPKSVPVESTSRKTSSDSAMISRRLSASKPSSATKPRVIRTPSGKVVNASLIGSRKREQKPDPPSPASSDLSSSSFETPARSLRTHRNKEASLIADSLADLSDTSTEDEEAKAAKEWKRKKASILKKLPPGVDQHAAKQILNEIVVRGDEVHWSDIAGLEVAKNALRETVVYPFLRPDLFMGLREPARGMLLFGPPGTGKTMLARAVATESKSTFFSISASSLTSKYLGESEKLVRALFALAKVLAPSIIFVDEIDSLLSQRSGTGEHEATRRIKTEFLIQWSDLQRAAAGREPGEKDKERGDANRVLVLAATNLPWAIDEAARRRFVRRQYIPLPEPETRKVQIMTLLKQQQHTLSEEDIDTLVGLTEGFSGSDITALAKDAAMGPLRSLGDALLHMSMDEIRPIELSDFVASLATIRPSVSKSSLKEYEDWAREFGERGG